MIKIHDSIATSQKVINNDSQNSSTNFLVSHFSIQLIIILTVQVRRVPSQEASALRGPSAHAQSHESNPV